MNTILNSDITFDSNIYLIFGYKPHDIENMYYRIKTAKHNIEIEEYPEHKKHPSRQLEMCFQWIEDIIENDKIYIVQTMSETIIKIFSTMIQQKVIDKDFVKCIFVEDDEDYFVSEFTENGYLINYKQNFFNF